MSILSFQMDENQPSQPTNNPVSFPGPTPIPSNSPKKNWKWLVILILFLLVIGGVTFFVFKSSRSTSTSESPTPDSSSNLTNIATPQSSPTSTPSTTVDKTQIKIQVLNGTGIPGEASYLSGQLNTLGYTNVTTGNAPTQNATDTQVTYSSTVTQDVSTEITNKLKDIYTNVTTNNASVSGADIQIITGSRKGQATPTPTPTTSETTSPSPTATP